jgi:predicted lipoprotein with Yx(FWY)xxD motif
MNSMFSRRLGRAMLVLGGVAVAAVGGTTWATAGSSSSVSAVSAATTSASTHPSSSSGTSSSSSSSSAAVTVMTRNGPMGAYLTDGQGRSLYLFLADKNGKSSCNGACAAAWPPLLTSGTPQAGSGATGGMLGTTTRDDGTKQVTYNNHPLYMYSLDKQPGNTNGQGVNAFGALWWLVSPSGSAITTTSSSSGSAPSSSGGTSSSPGGASTSPGGASTSPGGAPGGPGY